jgi:hypothetical protein
VCSFDRPFCKCPSALYQLAQEAIADKFVSLFLYDPAEETDYARQPRWFRHDETDLVLVCFDVTNRASFASVTQRWKPELERHRAKMDRRVNFVLVATKIELRENAAVIARMRSGSEAPITFEEGGALARELGMAAYAETSAMSGEGISTLFRSCCVMFLQSRAACKRNCVVQ